MKKLHEVSHEAYKNGTLNAKSLDSLSKTFMRADKGDAKAKAEISRLLKDKKLLASKISKGSMAKGGEIDAFIMKFVKDAPASNLRVDSEELTAKLKKGGKLGFDGLAKKVAKRYEGKPVERQFQNEYGKTYNKKEAMEVGKKWRVKYIANNNQWKKVENFQWKVIGI